MEMSIKFAVLNCDTKLSLHLTSEMLSCDNLDDNTLDCEAGTLIKLHHTPNKNRNSKICIVQILDYENRNPIYEENLYECSQKCLRKVKEDLWKYIISIVSPKRRLQLLQNNERCQKIIYYKQNEVVYVTGECFYQKDAHYKCIIRYIGVVPELHPFGYFFGMELMESNFDKLAYTKKLPFLHKYMECEPSLALFTTADYILPLTITEVKTYSPSSILSETLDRVRTVFNGTGENYSNTGSSKPFTERKSKKDKKSSHLTQFYDNMDSTDASANNMEHRPLSSTKPLTTTITYTEEYKPNCENYEQNVERRNTGKLCLNMTPQIQPVGILKHNTTSSSTINTAANINTGERDNIYGQRKTGTDLADLVGSNWMATANVPPPILKQAQKQYKDCAGYACSNNSNVVNLSTQTKSDRNRSPSSFTYNNAPISIDHNYLAQRLEAAHLLDTTKSNIDASYNLGETAASAAAVSANRRAVIELPNLDFACNSPLQEVPETGLGVGSLVEVSLPDTNKDSYGVIRWIGVPPDANEVMVGVELEEDHIDKRLYPCDGSFNGVPLFKCPEGRAIFVCPFQCAIDRRFADLEGAVGGKLIVNTNQPDTKLFGHVECPSVAGAVEPLKPHNRAELEKLCGKFKGIQGHHNSCYLDATLFSMFTFTPVFDSLLFRPPDSDDIADYCEVQKVLREEIVNPLRKNVFVRADRVMKLRKLLDKLSSVSGLTSEEKDPEEFLNSLLAQIMRVEPFLKLSSGQDAYFYQLFVEKDERLLFPTVQQLFEQSFHSSDIKLKEVPSCLIIQMPRFGKNFKMYPRILPSQVLDVTDIIEDSPRQCTVCGKLAEHECRDCFGNFQRDAGLESTAFCYKCLDTVHRYEMRLKHNFRTLSVPEDYRIMEKQEEKYCVPRLYMELFAVVCIETSHYVTFVKAGSGPDAPWCFFDSMADRKGEKNGYNIPEIQSVPNLPQWLTEEGARTVNETSSNDKMLPAFAKRLFCDAYMCMYQSTDIMMYH